MTFTFVVVLALAQSPDEIAARVAELASALADPGGREAADRELERICLRSTRPGADDERRAVARALAGALEREDLPAAAKTWIVRRLERVGSYEAVRPLARLLDDASDAELRDAARRALESNPTVPALYALRKALERAEGEFRGAIIRSLGVRRDLLSVGPILDVARTGPPALRGVALEALAEIGERSALDTLEEAIGSAEGREKEKLLELYVRYAYRLKANDEGGAARRIFIRLAEMGGRWRVAGIIGIGVTGIPSEVPTVMRAVEDRDPAARSAGLEALVHLRGGLPAVIERLPGAPPELRIELLRVLGRRADAPASEPALAAIVAASRDPDESVQLAAVEALADLGTGGAVDALVALLGAASERTRGAAERALGAADFTGAGAAATAALKGETDAPRRAALVRVLGRRGGPGHAAAIVAAASDPADEVRRAAYGALANVDSETALDALLGAVKKESGETLDAALAAFGGHRGEGVTGRLLMSLDVDLSDEAQAGLIRILGGRDHPDVLPMLLEAANSAKRSIHDASIAGLARSGAPEALDVLLTAAATSPAVRDVALRGCLRAAEAIAREDRARPLDVYFRVLELAGRDDERRAALRGIGEVGGPGALERIARYLKSGPLQRDAGRAALRLAERLPENERERAIAVYRSVLDLDVDEATLTQALRRLRRLGVDIDFAARRGAISRWWILGPFPGAALDAWASVVAREGPIDTSAPVAVGGTTLKWKEHATDHPFGIVDLLQAVENADGLGAFMYAQVDVESAGDAVLRMGSDDQVHCWLDGEKVHSFTGDRGVAPDQDRVPVKLREGVNRILLAVVNSGGGWAGVLRITDADGKPVAFTVRER